MRALILTSFAGPDAVEVTEIDSPEPGPGEVLVEVHYAAAGAWDLMTTQGWFARMGGLTTFPQVLGWDFAGSVAAVGDGVTTWVPGDDVLGFSAQPWTGQGAFAERIAVPAGLLSRRPAGLAAPIAATLPVTVLTADLAVRTAAIEAGESVLVLGGAGGVGRLVVQLAKAAGALVIASVAPAEADLVRKLGADATVDRNGDVAAQALALATGDGHVHVVIDTAGPAAWTGAIGALVPGGRFITTIPADVPGDELGLKSTVLQVQPDPVRLAALAQQVTDGTLVPIPGSDPVPMSAARLGQPGTGKLVLDPRQ